MIIYNPINFSRGIKLIAIIAIIGLILSAPSVFAATTIGTNITTNGNLTVDGSLQFTSGAGAGRALVSDGAGNATWTALDTLWVAENPANLYYTDARADARITLQKGAIDGLATLNGTGKVPSSQLPPLAIANTYVVPDQASRLALAAIVGDVAVQTDISTTFILAALPASVNGNWVVITPPAAVISVNGQVGIVALTPADLGLGIGSSPTFTGLTLSGLTSGSVPFAGVGGTISQDNTNLFWNNTSKRLGIGTNSPNYSLDVAGSIKAGNGSLVLLGTKTDPDPAGVNGAMYYNTSTDRFRCFENSAWKDCDTARLTSLQKAYENGATTTTAGAVDIAYTLTAGNFNVGGAGSVNLTPTTASQFTSGGALTLTGGAASTWGTSAGNLNLQAAGAGTTANVQIGAGVASATPDQFVLDLGSAEPAGTNGALYYNTGTNKFRCYQNGAWTDCISVGGGGGTILSSLTAAVTANSINNGDNAQTWNWILTNNNKSGITFGENTASTGTGTSIVNVSTLASSTAVPLVVNNIGNGDSFRVNDSSSDTSPFLIDKDGNVAVGATSFDPVFPEKFKVDAGATSSYNVIKGSGDINSSLNLSMQNRNAGTGAMSVVAAISDSGSATTNTVAMGITSSGFNDPINYGLAGPNDAFLVTLGDDLIVGTAIPGGNIKFISTGGMGTGAEQMRIDGSGNVGIGTTSAGSKLDVKGTLRLSGSASGYVGLAPAAAAGSQTYTLPNSDGSAGQVISTNGSGILSWINPTGMWQRVGTTLSPTTAGDDVTTSGNISTSGTGTITSAGLLTGNTGLTVSSGDVNINTNSNFNTYINAGTSTGTVNIGNSLAGAVVIESASTINLQGGASTITTPTTEIKFQPAGTATTGLVKIGEGGAGSTTPDLLALDVKSDAGDPGSGTNGAMYYNASSNKIRCYVNGAWSDCASATLSSISAAQAANSINNGDNAQTWNWILTNNNKSGITFGENTASTGTNTSIVNVSNLATSTAVPLVVNNIGSGDSFRVNDTSGDTTPFLVDKDGNVAIGSTSFDPINPEKLKVDSGNTSSYNVIKGSGDINSSLNLSMQNRNAGTDAQSVVAAMADNGGPTQYIIAMGMLSSGFSSAGFPIGGPDDSYLMSLGNNLIVGVGLPAANIKFITGGGFFAANERMRIDSSGNVGIGTTAINARLDLSPSTADALRIEPYGAVAGNTGNLELMELAANGSNYVGFKAPDSIAANKVWTLPNADGTGGQVLSTDGSGVLSWINPTGMWQRVGTTLSPTNAGDDVTTSGNISTSGSGTITSAGLLSGSLGATISGADISLNDNSSFNTKINTGTSAGTVTIGSANAGAVGVTSGAALTLAGGTASSLSTTAGDITIQPAGTVTTANVQIGAGQPGSGTPDLFVLDAKSTAGDPATGADGAMYFNESEEKFKCHLNGSWSNCDTTGGTLTLQSAYNGGAAITTYSSADIAYTLTSGNFTASGAGSVNLTPTGASSFTSGGALTLTGGGPSTWSTSSGALTLTSAVAATWGTSAGDLTLQAAGTGAANVKIGTGGAGSTAPDLLALDVKSTTGDPAGGYNGAMYYNQFDAVFRCYEAGGWKDCGATAASATTLQQAYTAGPTITTAGSDVALVLTSGNFTASGAGSVNLTPAGASSFTSSGALTLTGGATSTWSVTGAGNDLTIDAADVLSLGTTNATGITIGKSGVTTTNIGTLQTGNAATTGSFKIADGSTNFITLTSPAIAADYTLTLPVDDGTSGQALTTNGSGTLSWASLLTDPMTTRGDIIIRNASNVTAALGRGTVGQVLKSDGTDIAYATLTSSDVGLSNVTNNAQLNQSIGTAKGDLIAYTASNTPTRLPVGGTNSWVLTVDSSQATGMKWAANTPAADSLDFTEFNDAMTVDANTSINLANKSLTINDLVGGGAGTLNMSTNGAALTLTAGAASTWSTSTGALTVDSAAGLNLGTTNATGITIGKSGVTTTNIGTLQTGNAATTGSFKIADGSTNFITLTSPAIAADYTLTLPVDDGTANQALTTNGSGTLAWSTVFTDPMSARGDIIIRDATNTTARLAKGTAGQVLKSDGTDIAYATLTGTDVGLANVTNDAQVKQAIGTAKGDLIAYTASNTPARLAVGGTNGFVLTVDATQASGMKWSSVASSLSNALDFTEFKDAMTIDANSSIAMASKNLTINDVAGSGILTLAPGAALTMTAGAASTWSTSSGALTLDSADGLNLGTTNATSLSIGRAAATLAIASTGLNVTTGGALTGVASIDTITTSSTALTFAGAGTVSPGGANNLTLGTTNATSATNIQSGTGSINLQPAGTGSVTIGTADTTGTLLVLDTKTDAGNPGGTNGAMYYNSNANKFRCYENSAWKDCDTSGLATLQQAYNNGATITTSGPTDIAFTLAGGNFTATGAGAVLLTPTSNSSFTSGGILTLTAGAASTWSTTGGALTVDSAAALNLGTTNATSVSIGKAGVLTTVNDGLTVTTTLTASNGMTLTTGAMNLTATSGALTMSGMSASSMNFGVNNLTITSGNLNTTATGINTTNIGTTTPGTGKFTTLTSTGTTDLANAGASNVTIATTGTGTVAIGNATGTFALTSSGGLNVTTGGVLTGVASIDANAVAQTLTIGNSTGATALNLTTGTGNLTVTTPNANGSIFKTSTATDDTIRLAPGINAGAATFQGTLTSTDLTAARTWTLPDATGTLLTSGNAWAIGGNAPGGASILGTTDNSALTIQTGTGALNIGTDAAAKTITIGNGTGATSLVLNAGTGNIDIGANAFARAINVGTGGAAQTVIVGSTNGASALTLQSGTGALNIQTQGTGGLNIGTNAVAQTITIGNGTGATSVVINDGTGALNIGTNAIAHTITIGNQTGASALTLDSGTGAINIGTGIAKAITIGNTTGTTGITLNTGTGKVRISGTIPTATAPASMTAGSSDNAGIITSTAAAHTTVALTFSSTWTTAPFCVFSPANAAAGTTMRTIPGGYVTTTATTMTITHVSSTTVDAWSYHCFRP